jgi:hypothetical protein
MKRYNFFNIILGNDSQQYELTFELEDHGPAQTWASLISKTSPNDLRKTLDPWRGINRDWNKKIQELKDLIDSLNEWMPNKIPGTFDDDKPRESLNRLHIHFPDQFYKESNRDHQKHLSRYNDLIHEIEGIHSVLKYKKEHFHLLNSFERPIKEKIEDDDYRYFDPNISFGDLKIHYCHVGRNPLEIFFAQDFNCPPEQIICQHLISGNFKIFFHDYVFDREKFKTFYYLSNIKWPYRLNDPRLAIGSIKAGSLVLVDSRDFLREDIFSKIRACNKIISWEVT